MTVCNLMGVSKEKLVYHSRNPKSPYNMKYIPLLNATKEYLQLEGFTKDEGKKILNEMMAETVVYANLGDEAEKLGYSINDMILNCTHSGNLCYESDFKLFQHPEFFNCYTYTGGDKYQKSSLAGPDYGLSLVLYSEALDLVLDTIHNEYGSMNPIGNTRGIRVVIHAPETFPNVKEEGTDISPGMSTSISLSISKESRIDKPYADCYQQVGTKLNNGYKTDLNTCRMLCKDSLLNQR